MRGALLRAAATSVALVILGCEGGLAPSQTLAPSPSAVAPTSVPTKAPTPSSTEPSAANPAPRGYHALVDVPGELGVLLISGSERPPANFLAETWAFTPATGWSNLDPNPVISVTDHAAYAAASGRVYAGVGETWLFDPEASAWRKVAIAGPPFEPGSRSAYDSQSDRIVLFSADGSTWALDVAGEAWQRMAPAVSPPARGWGGLAYDPVTDRVVLFGGVGTGDEHLADTWAYDLDTDTWTELEATLAPAGRTYGAMTYDAIGERLLLFGGANGVWEAEAVLDDTWAFDVATSTWTELSPTAAPTARAWHAMASDAETGLVVLFGGGPDRRHYTAETWLFDSTANTWRAWLPD